MENKLTIEKIASALEALILPYRIEIGENADLPLLIIPKEKIFPSLQHLKTEFKFGFLTTLCGIHYPESNGREFCIMYQLHNLVTNERIRIKTFLNQNDLHIDTITPLWATANWMEREAFDFYGIVFTGHPFLERILNVEDMSYHPMRREYRLEDGERTDKDDTYFGR